MPLDSQAVADKGRLFAEGVDTGGGRGQNFGFRVSRQRIVANRAWTESNPAAARLFDVMTIDPDDIVDHNLRLHRGETTVAEVEADVDAWIRRNRGIYERWLAKARSAAR